MFLLLLFFSEEAVSALGAKVVEDLRVTDPREGKSVTLSHEECLTLVMLNKLRCHTQF